METEASFLLPNRGCHRPRLALPGFLAKWTCQFSPKVESRLHGEQGTAYRGQPVPSPKRAGRGSRPSLGKQTSATERGPGPPRGDAAPSSGEGVMLSQESAPREKLSNRGAPSRPRGGPRRHVQRSCGRKRLVCPRVRPEWQTVTITEDGGGRKSVAISAFSYGSPERSKKKMNQFLYTFPKRAVYGTDASCPTPGRLLGAACLRQRQRRDRKHRMKA
ncbi:uncharacterized protein LOC105297661 isoform X2 [Pteropus vampyrus]|uniref:Uncharacterized protein LOC105297661 isoform X2 n=1 Tax=Pteropus vampyrus TaxID=132908 RepID=A0A6P6CVK5_PTEVA|nr:uncharacterized protein LOC105297661 isoform X2 [Pteropus vampyrus]